MDQGPDIHDGRRLGMLWGLLRTVLGMYILARQTAETGMTAPPFWAAGIAEDLISTVSSLRFMFCAVLLAYGIYLPLQTRLEDRIRQQASES